MDFREHFICYNITSNLVYERRHSRNTWYFWWYFNTNICNKTSKKEWMNEITKIKKKQSLRPSLNGKYYQNILVLVAHCPCMAELLPKYLLAILLSLMTRSFRARSRCQPFKPIWHRVSCFCIYGWKSIQVIGTGEVFLRQQPRCLHMNLPDNGNKDDKYQYKNHCFSAIHLEPKNRLKPTKKDKFISWKCRWIGWFLVYSCYGC